MWGNRRGTEPLEARSALRARMLLSGVALPIALAAAIVFAYAAVATGEGVWAVESGIAAFIALVAAIDLLVIWVRIRRRRRAEKRESEEP
ncbi:DUF6343 family protein [Microtetraspora sp. NBRC 16547]|uniref:DUF6343 family protein n=1 Tax=Microtetraspora sp. NBRC 16547 TaxID=3030993 RepID=UPI0024A2F6CC|nr:DUF6343 family protein [Microtetraspora sp. NBRC 16547]GLX01006.1 hypothetical protein Misp02_50920 [Microtetraspora sp. NBRC 16547]